MLRVRRWHEGVGTDEKPARALGYASSGCVRQKLRPTACGRQCSGAAEELRARGQRLKDMNIESHEYAVYAYDTE